MAFNSPVYKKIMAQSAAEGQSALASSQHLRQSLNKPPQSLGNVEEPTAPDFVGQTAGTSMGDMYPTPPPVEAPASSGGDFMSKLYQVETKGGTMSDRKGSQYKGIAQIGDDIRKPLLKKMGYTEDQYNASRDIQKKVANKHIGNLKSRLKKSGFEVSDINLWTAHNQGVAGMNQIIHNKVSPGVLKNLRNQAGMNSKSTAKDYLAHYGKIFN